MDNKSLNWELLQCISRDAPGYEHTKLLEVEILKDSKGFDVYKYGEETGKHGGITIGSYRDERGDLYIAKTECLKHTIVIGNTGRGKSQGFGLNTLFTADGSNSMLVMDPKGELSSLTYSYLAKKYGSENVKIINFRQPQYTTATINLFEPLADEWLAVEKKRDKEKIRKHILTELRKLTDLIYPIKKCEDESWQTTGRKFVYGMLVALFEDLTLSPVDERKYGRKRVLPCQINFASLQEIFSHFSWGTRFDDKGFLSRRNKNSLAYQLTRAVMDNAQTTRANYMGFVEGYINMYSDSKVQQISIKNTINFEGISETPQVVFLVYDLSDIAMREWVNKVVARWLDVLLQKSHRTSKPLPVSVQFICEEFATLEPSELYPNILATGRGSGLYLTMILQSFKQLESRYPQEHIAMRENCDVQIYLGTQDITTTRQFIDNMGRVTIPDPEAFIRGEFHCKEVHVTTEHYLMHEMPQGEVFINLTNSNPIHSRFELYYKTPQYKRYETLTILPPATVKLDDPTLIYDAPWMHPQKKDAGMDMDDFL
jgi:type IV secretory pathway TraG/TraD family ATPase VirD4